MNALTEMPVPRIGLWATAAIAALLLSACGTSKPPPRPPVEDRSAGRSAAAPPLTPPASGTSGAGAAARPAPEGGRFYTVRPGDTLVRIGLDQGQNWRDIARWNNLENPNLIEVGQVLRVSPPVTEAPARTAAGATVGGAVAAGSSPAAGTQPVGGSRVEPRPLDARPDPGVEPSRASAPRNEAGAGGAAAVEDVVWAWPASGPVLASFEEQRNNKGIDIGGKAGDPVLAAAEGRVVYAGSGLRGYGNLVIIKHNATFLTAYAHNQALLVKEDQTVRRGQRIAEMGSSDAERVQLHFEIRREGRPVDPLKYLPAR